MQFFKYCSRFLSSFNRSNLKYSVLPKKGKSCNAEIIDLIKEKFPKTSSGIVYCFSRKDCENTAKELTAAGVKTVAYHAGLNDKERAATQGQWLYGKVQVCTILSPHNLHILLRRKVSLLCINTWSFNCFQRWLPLL